MPNKKDALGQIETVKRSLGHIALESGLSRTVN